MEIRRSVGKEKEGERYLEEDERNERERETIDETRRVKELANKDTKKRQTRRES